MINYLLWFLEVAAVVLPILLAGLLLWLLFRRRQRANGKVLPPLSPLRMIFMLALAGDILITLLLTLVSRPVRVSFQPYPLASWIEAWNCWTRPLFEQLFLNVAVFLPFGGLLALTFPALRRLPRIAGLSFAFSLCIECLQLLFRRGVFDADDLLGGDIDYPQVNGAGSDSAGQDFIQYLWIRMLTPQHAVFIVPAAQFECLGLLGVSFLMIHSGSSKKWGYFRKLHSKKNFLWCWR